MRQQKNEWGMGLGIFATKLKKNWKHNIVNHNNNNDDDDDDNDDVVNYKIFYYSVIFENVFFNFDDYANKITEYWYQLSV